MNQMIQKKIKEHLQICIIKVLQPIQREVLELKLLQSFTIGLNTFKVCLSTH